MNDYISFVIKLVRKEAGLTQEGLAVELDVSPAHIGLLEQGKSKPSYETMRKIVENYNIDANLFFGRTQQTAKSISASTVQIMQNLLTEVSEKVRDYGDDVDNILTETTDADE
jgi:transcriptional regulator with XRE-family HTH domain